MLQGLTRLAILGDFTRAGEGVALDDVSALILTFLLNQGTPVREQGIQRIALLPSPACPTEISTSSSQPSFPLACQQAGVTGADAIDLLKTAWRAQ